MVMMKMKTVKVLAMKKVKNFVRVVEFQQSNMFVYFQTKESRMTKARKVRRKKVKKMSDWTPFTKTTSR